MNESSGNAPATDSLAEWPPILPWMSSRLCLPGHDLCLLSAIRSKRSYRRAPAVTDGSA